MGVRINPAGHDVASGGIEGLIAFQIWPDLSDPAIFNQNIRFICQVRRYDGTAFDYFAHPTTPCCARRIVFSMLRSRGMCF